MFESTRCTNELFVIQPDSDIEFTAEMDGEEIGLVAVVQIQDSRGLLTDEERKDLGLDEYPFVVSMWLVPDGESVSKETDAGWYNDEYYPEELAEYGKGVPVNPESARIVENDGVGVEDELDFDVEGNQVAFREWDAAERYVTEFIPEKMPVIRGMVGFWLDKPFNRIGTTGWDRLRSITIDPDYNAFSASLDRAT